MLIQWKDLPSCETSWESAARMLEALPTFDLEDNMKLLGPGIDRIRPPLMKFYQRTNKSVAGNNDPL